MWFACSSFLAQQLGKEFDRVAEAVLPSLIQLIPNSVKIMSTSGTTTVGFIVRVSLSITSLRTTLSSFHYFIPWTLYFITNTVLVTSCSHSDTTFLALLEGIFPI